MAREKKTKFTFWESIKLKWFLAHSAFSLLEREIIIHRPALFYSSERHKEQWLKWLWEEKKNWQPAGRMDTAVKKEGKNKSWVKEVKVEWKMEKQAQKNWWVEGNQKYYKSFAFKTENVMGIVLARNKLSKKKVTSSAHKICSYYEILLVCLLFPNLVS